MVDAKGGQAAVGVPMRFFPRALKGSLAPPPKPAILLFNPWATRTGRVPNSLLHIAAALGDGYDIELVDGNLESDPWAVIEPRNQATGRSSNPGSCPISATTEPGRPAAMGRRGVKTRLIRLRAEGRR